MKRGWNFFSSFFRGEQKWGKLTFYPVFGGAKSILAAIAKYEGWLIIGRSNFGSLPRMIHKVVFSPIYMN